MHMLADIAQGDTGTADILFLIAAIFFGLAAVTRLFYNPAPANPPGARVWPWTGFLVDVGLCLTVLGLLLQ